MDIFPEVKTTWKRPANVIFPTVWHRFVTKPKDGKVYKIRIEDLPKQRTTDTEVMQFLLKNYFSDTGLSTALKILENETSMKAYKYLQTHMMGQNISIVAVIDDDSPNPQIVGLQIISVKFKRDPDLPEEEQIQKKRKIYLDILKNCNPFEIFGSDFYLTDFGLCVAPEFRRLGIAANILNSLSVIGQAYGLKGTMMLFTKIESQDLAEKCGFQLYNEIEYSEYKGDEGDVMFSIKGTKSLKLMGKVF